MPAMPERKQQQLFSLIQTWAPYQLSQHEPDRDSIQTVHSRWLGPTASHRAEGAKTKIQLVTEVD